MNIARVPKNNHAKFQDQQSKGIDATEPQSWSKSQKTRFLVIFAIFEGFGRGRTSASFGILTSNLAYYTSYTYSKYNWALRPQDAPKSSEPVSPIWCSRKVNFSNCSNFNLDYLQDEKRYMQIPGNIRNPQTIIFYTTCLYFLLRLLLHHGVKMTLKLLFFAKIAY